MSELSPTPVPDEDCMDDQVSRQEFGTTSEYVQELIRHDRDRVQIRALLVEVLESPSAVAADEVYFEELRTRIT